FTTFFPGTLNSSRYCYFPGVKPVPWEKLDFHFPAPAPLSVRTTRAPGCFFDAVSPSVKSRTRRPFFENDPLALVKTQHVGYRTVLII
ncbi:hypothetical protein AVEN_181237-1, partial [Araneus ventricosus]